MVSGGPGEDSPITGNVADLRAEIAIARYV
jgi:hypothetical protein